MKDLFTKYLLIITLNFIFCQVYISQDTIKGYKYSINHKSSKFNGKELQKQYIIEQSIETIAENNEDEDIDYTTLFDLLSFYYEHPINLNKKNILDDLTQLRLLNQFQINALLDHIEKHGKLITIYELQVLDLFNMNDIRRLMPFVLVSTDFNAPNLSISEMFKYGKNDLFIRYNRVIEPTSGQREIDDSSWLDSRNTVQLGSPDNIYMRYRFKYLNNISFGITAEKDAGEAFIPNKRASDLFGINTKAGFDFYSAHFYMKNIGKFKALALGDYHVQLGQGLTFWSGLAFGKSSDIMGVKRNPMGIKPYSSVDENLFLRGAAAEIGWKKLNFLVFGSKKMIDANLQQDSTNTDGDITVSSFQASGNHGTIGDLENKDALEESVFGGEVSIKDRKYTIGLITSLSMYNGNINRTLSPYSQFQFNSNFNWVTGAHYNWIHRNFNFFGEISRSNNNGIAQLHGLMASLHPKVSFSAFYRNYGKDYQNLFTNAVGEGSKSINEKGILSGIDFKLTKKLTLSSYFDQFSFPWMRYQVDAPNTSGFDIFTQIKYKPTKKLEVYTRIRHRNKPYNSAQDVERDLDPVLSTDQWNYRFNINVQISESIQIRSRVEYMTYYRVGSEKESGLLLLQDIIYKPPMKKLSLNARFALFDTQSYNSRIYSYENDVLYYYRIPAYYNKGSRTYINARYKLKKGIDLWLRWSQWNYNNVEQISSGINEIDDNKISEIRFQVRFQF